MFLLCLVCLLCIRAAAQSTFTDQPMSVVQAEGLDAVFECLYPGAFVHSWGINGVFPADNANITRRLASQDSPASLTIAAIPQYNNTVVQCEAVIRGERSAKVSENATLQVQGPLEAVLNLQFVMESSSSSVITISWDPPFSLNLTTAEPDIQYCVEVYNVTDHDPDILISSECLSTTFYAYSPKDPTPDNVFNFKITPRSNLPRALNGTVSEPVQGYLIFNPVTIPSVAISYNTNSDLSPITWQFLKNVTGTSPGRFPTDYFVHLQSTDNLDLPSQCNCPATREVIDDVIKLTLQWCLNCGLQRHRLYNYTITAANSAGTSTSDPAQLSTHDVQSLTASQRIFDEVFTNSTSIAVTCSYLLEGTSTGIFAIVHSVTNNSDVYFVVADRNGEPSTRVFIKGLSRDMYNVIVFDRGEDFLPKEWPAGSEVAALDQFQSALEPPGESSMSILQPSSEILTVGNYQACINCSFSQISVKACVAIIYPTQNEDNFGKQLKIHTINTSTAFDCFQVDEEEYHIAVFGLLHDVLERVPAVKTFVRKASSELPTESTSSFLTVIAISLSMFLFLMLCAIVTIIVAICASKHFKTRVLKNTKHEAKSCEMTFPGIEQPNEAYNIVKTLTPNEAYNVFHTSRVSHNTGIQSPTPVTTSSPVHIYDEPIFPPASTDPQPEQIYAEIITQSHS